MVMINKFLLFLSIVACIVCAVFAYIINRPQTEKRQRLEEQRIELEKSIEEQKREIAKIKEDCSRFESDPEFVERQARKNHRIRPGEIEFIFEAPKDTVE